MSRRNLSCSLLIFTATVLVAIGCGSAHSQHYFFATKGGAQRGFQRPREARASPDGGGTPCTVKGPCPSPSPQ